MKKVVKLFVLASLLFLLSACTFTVRPVADPLFAKLERCVFAHVGVKYECDLDNLVFSVWNDYDEGYSTAFISHGERWEDVEGAARFIENLCGEEEATFYYQQGPTDGWLMMQVTQGPKIANRILSQDCEEEIIIHNETIDVFTLLEDCEFTGDAELYSCSVKDLQIAVIHQVDGSIRAAVSSEVSWIRVNAASRYLEELCGEEKASFTHPREPVTVDGWQMGLVSADVLFGDRIFQNDCVSEIEAHNAQIINR